jgi:hypothetical protein
MTKLLLAPIAAFVFAASTHGVGAPVAKGTNYLVNADNDECKANAVCTVKVTLQAQNGFHVNKDYPYKFKADEVAGIEFQGTDAGGKNVFSKAAGDFVIKADKNPAVEGVLTIKYKAAKAGDAKITGKFKLSVCSDANCQMDTADLALPVHAK